MTVAWPSGVPSPALANSLSVVPFRAPLATDMDDGPKRRRRASTKNIATAPFTVRMQNSEFLTFKAWVRDTLVDGTLPFTMPVWTGSAYQTRTCSFVEPYKDNPAGGFYHDVSLNLDVEDY